MTPDRKYTRMADARHVYGIGRDKVLALEKKGEIVVHRPSDKLTFIDHKSMVAWVEGETTRQGAAG